MHSCWCILLIECGLNSNFYLNSNLFELGIEKIRNRKQTQNHLNPVSPTKPEVAHGSLSFFQPKPGGPISPHAGPVFSPHGPHHSPASPCAQRQSRFGPRSAQPASARPRLTPLTSRPHWSEPSPSSAQDPRRDAAPLLHAATRCPLPRGPP